MILAGRPGRRLAKADRAQAGLAADRAQAGLAADRAQAGVAAQLAGPADPATWARGRVASWLPGRAPRTPHPRRRSSGGAEVADLCDAVAGLVSAGLPPGAALAAVVAVTGPGGSPVAAALARVVAPGGPAWSQGLAAAARVAGRSGDLSARERQALGWWGDAMALTEPLGVPVREVLGVICAHVRAADSDVAAAHAAAAGPRAGAAVLTAMPLACLGLGALLGADVLATLLTTAVGRVCLLVGAVSWAAGRWWIRRLVAAAVAPLDAAPARRRRREGGSGASGPGPAGASWAGTSWVGRWWPGGPSRRCRRVLGRVDPSLAGAPGPARRPHAAGPRSVARAPLPAALLATVLAVGVEAGLAPQPLLAAVAQGLADLGHPLARPLAEVASGVHRAGPDPRARNGREVSTSAFVSDLARALQLAERAGVPPAGLLRQAASAQLRRQRHAREVALSRLPVLLVLPSGLLLLPAAVVLGVVPVVVDLLGRTLHG